MYFEWNDISEVKKDLCTFGQFHFEIMGKLL